MLQCNNDKLESPNWWFLKQYSYKCAVQRKIMFYNCDRTCTTSTIYFWFLNSCHAAGKIISNESSTSSPHNVLHYKNDNLNVWLRINII